MSDGLEGQVFGCLTVLERGEDYVWSYGQRREPRWLCRCKCGREAQYRESRLRNRPPWHCANCTPARVEVTEKCQWCPRPRAYSDPAACRRCYDLSRRNGTCHRCGKPRQFSEGCGCEQGITARTSVQGIAESESDS